MNTIIELLAWTLLFVVWGLLAMWVVVIIFLLYIMWRDR